jgi:hypothetical protein
MLVNGAILPEHCGQSRTQFVIRLRQSAHLFCVRSSAEGGRTPPPLPKSRCARAAGVPRKFDVELMGPTLASALRSAAEVPRKCRVELINVLSISNQGMKLP